MQAPVAVSKQEAVKAIIDEVVEALAPDVLYIRFNFGEDWLGNPSVFFRVLLSDEASQDHRRHALALRIYQLIDDRIDRLNLGVNTHFNIRSSSEQDALKDAKWA